MQKFHHEALLPTAHTTFDLQELEGSVGARFSRIAGSHSDHVAISTHHRTLNYGQLERRANGLARLLLDLRARDPQPVALLFRQGASCAMAQLAVLKAGSCYSHIDHELPLERQLMLLADLGATLLLCDADCLIQAEALSAAVLSAAELSAAVLPAEVLPAEVLSAAALSSAAPQPLRVIDIEALSWADAPEPPPLPIRPEDDACIVYTSGSTGVPQGVVLTHRNVLAIARNHGRDFRLDSHDRATQLCPLWTAASCSEIFSALLNGCTLYPCAIKEQGIPAFLRLLDDAKITTLTAAPPLFRMLFSAVEAGRRFESVRLVRLGGDRTMRTDLALFRQHFGVHCLLRLGYGAAEFMQITQLFIGPDDQPIGDIIPVGYAMTDCELVLLDDEGRPVPNGEYGEIAASSRYLSKGYWRNPALTQERYRIDPADPSRRLYLTRDLGYLDHDGNLHHVGRKDARVKLNGKLVLMSDIELALLTIPGVKDAVVIPVVSDARGTELTAFVAAEAGTLDARSARAELARRIAPELMPRTLTVLDALPLGLSNKINRLTLKQLAESRRGGGGDDSGTAA